jgi:hypothetical protein
MSSPRDGALTGKGQASRINSVKKNLVSAVMSNFDIKKLADIKKNRFTDNKMFHNFVKSIFIEYDRDGNHRIEKEEIYEMVLKLYLQVATMTTVSSSTVPSRERVMKLFDMCDKDNSGYLDISEFEAMCIVLCEGMAARLSIAFLNKLVLAPVLGYILCEFMILLWELLGMHELFSGIMWVIPAWTYSETTLLAIGTGLANAFIFPYIMSLTNRYLDVYYKASNQAVIADGQSEHAPNKSKTDGDKIKER